RIVCLRECWQRHSTRRLPRNYVHFPIPRHHDFEELVSRLGKQSSIRTLRKRMEVWQEKKHAHARLASKVRRAHDEIVTRVLQRSSFHEKLKRIVHVLEH